ncbi:MAG: hypothetical protein MJZ65_04195 [Paludibacteraceae bacterium]|nr:hypothetical protein [Paludibacteraceae bacterium]
MRRYSLIIVFLLTIAVTSAKEVTRVVECGDKITLNAQPINGFHFVRWNDESEDSLRTIEVYQNAIFTAFFAPNCGDYAALPLVNRYDWILMLHVRKIVEEMHYTLSPDRVRWYRVVGDPDSVDDLDSTDDPKDTYLGEGYSFTLDKNLQQTGVYYAVVDLMEDDGLECYGLSRTELISFVRTDTPQREIRLLPNTIHPGGILHLVGLNPDISTTIRIYSVTGQLLMDYCTIGAEEYLLTAYPNTGIYEVQVLSDEDNIVLRYLVHQ